MDAMRKRIYDIIERSDGERLSTIYDVTMMIVIIVSMLPLSFKDSFAIFRWTDGVCVAIFILDYLLRLWTADCKLGRGRASFFLYPFTPMALIDLLSILPSVTAMSSSFRLFRLLRTLKVLRAFKFLRYSHDRLRFPQAEEGAARRRRDGDILCARVRACHL